MEEVRGFLAEWLRHFLESRDALFRTLESVSKDDEYDLRIRHKAKEQVALCPGQFGQEALGKLSPTKDIILVGFNTEENLQFILANWERLVSVPKLTIYMVNPVSETEKRWAINPHVHERICDADSLKTGLRAMFETVDVLTQDRIKSLIKHKE
jgi:hypothetical protein